MIDLKQPNQKKTIVTGTGIVSEAFRPEAGMSGNFKTAATPNSSGLVRRIYISRKPGGKPLDQKGADVRGQGAKLSWTQADSGRGVVLERGKIYYLNHQLLAIGEGKGPNSKSSFIRNASAGGAA